MLSFQGLFYALVSIGVLSVIYTGVVSQIASLGALIAIPIGYWLDLRNRIVVRVEWAKWVFLVVMGIAIAEFVGGLGWFYAVLDLLVMVTAAKLLSPKANRDYVQLMAVALLLILATSILTTDAMFSIFFLLYVICLSWTLMVFTVKVVVEGDDNPVRSPVATQQAHLPPPAAQGLLDGKLFGGALLVVGFVIVFTVLFFALFPRFGAGIIGGSLGQSRTSGMSDTIDFSSMSELQGDPSIALRLDITEGTVTFPTYLRGNVLDTYADKKWEATLSTSRLPVQDGQNRISNIDASGQPVSFRIFANDLGVRAIPLLPHTQYVRHKTTNILTRGDGTALLSSRFKGAFGIDAVAYPHNYQTIDQLVARRNNGTARITDSTALRLQTPAGKKRERYTALPESAGKVLNLVRKDVFGATPPRTAADSIQMLVNLNRHMRSTFTYDLRSPDLTNPLQSFWQQRAGHCEYFATVLTLAARALGFPARIVTGFAGGEQSKLGEYWVFRNTDAHSWVEVWFESYGWVVFDPTPPFNGDVQWYVQLAQNVQDWADIYNYWWVQQVIAYDLNSQASALNTLTEPFKVGTGRSRRQKFDFDGKTKELAIAFAVLIMIGLVAWWFRPRGAADTARQVTYNRSALRQRWRIAKIERKYGRRTHNETWQSYAQKLPPHERDWILAYAEQRYDPRKSRAD